MRLRYFELYWLTYNPKKLCSNFLTTLDSFASFRDKQAIELYKNKIVFEMPGYELKATLLENRYRVEYIDGSYDIPIEKQSCNYGGFRYFFHCPQCNNRMRILYCDKGKFLCRKCLNLGYFTQRIDSSARCLVMADKVKGKLESMGGSLDKKPPWIKKKTFKALKKKYKEYKGIKFDRIWLRKEFKDMSDEELNMICSFNPE